MTGYESKRAAARDKLEDDDALTIAYQSGYYDGKKAAQPALVPQRTWVGLTDELQAALWDASRAALPRFHTYATLIERELRILNT